MTTEAEILSQHQSSLRQAREKCLILQRNMVEPSPRGRHYIELREAIKRIEGTCRQMGHKRGDARWFKLGTVYMGRETTFAASRTGTEPRKIASAEHLAERFFVANNWAGFGQLAQLFEQGLRRVDDLATRKTERKGTLILPPWMMQ